MPKISIAETRTIISIVRNAWNYDLSNLALTHLRYRIDEVMEKYRFSNALSLTARFREDDSFFDEFLFRISVPQNEIFRDPEMWLLLKEKVLPEITAEKENFTVWFPDCTDICDAASLYFILKEAGISERADFIASVLSERMIREIVSDQTDVNHYLSEVMTENFRKVMPASPVSQYQVLTTPGNAYRKEIIQSIRFFRQDLRFEPVPTNISLILFRNKLLNLSSDYQKLIFDKLINSLDPGGFIVIGYKENVMDSVQKSQIVTVFDSGENVYRKNLIH